MAFKILTDSQTNLSAANIPSNKSEIMSNLNCSIIPPDETDWEYIKIGMNSKNEYRIQRKDLEWTIRFLNGLSEKLKTRTFEEELKCR
jgi:hypothetical protein